MSYGICRIQKFKATAVTGIGIHDQRKKDVSHTNPDIDRTKSAENYTLQDCDNFSSGVKNRIQELNLKRTPKEDAVVMCQALITSDKEFFDQRPVGQWKQFFVDAFKFVQEQYGAENIISATVHLDEKTPHMHINFVPVTDDGRLSAKSLFTRGTLRQLQTDFYEQVGSKYSLKRGESREEKRKHLSTEEYKQETRKARILKISASLDEKEKKLDEREIELDEQEKKLEQEIKRIHDWYFPKVREIQEDDLKAVKYGNWLTGRTESPHGIAMRLNSEFIEPLVKFAKHSHELSRRLVRAEERIENQEEPVKKYYDLVQGLDSEQIEKLRSQAEQFRRQNEEKKAREIQEKRERNRGRGI